MSWIIYILLFLALGFTIYRHRFFHLPGLPRTCALWLFMLKIIAGLAIWYVYTYYYPQREYADIWKYFDDSEIVYQALDENPSDYFKIISGIGIDENIQHAYFDQMKNWDQKFENNLFNDSHTIIRYNALLRLISGGNYHTHSLVMCFLAFIGLCAIYHWLYKWLWQWKKAVVFILFVSPSLLFWSSGVLKEGILFFALGMLILHAWRFADDKKRYRLFWIIVSVWLLAMTKLYMLVFVIPSLLFAIHLIRNPRFALLKFVSLIMILIGISFAIHYTKPDYSPFRIIANKQNDFLNLARGGTYLMDSLHVVYLRPDQQPAARKSPDNYTWVIGPNTEIVYWKIADDFRDTLYRKTQHEEYYMMLSETPVAGSLMNVKQLRPSASSVLSEIPAALQRSILRPYPLEIKPVMVIPATLENILMLLMLFTMILWFRKPSSKAVFWFCVAFGLIILTVTGLTTPVLGALVRYRITAIPFLLFAILLCMDRAKLDKKFPVLSRFC
jgi:hypothetical protein